MQTALVKKDVSREGATREKFIHQGRLLRPKNNHAVVKVSSFRHVNIRRINELLGTNFKGVILDVDECVAPHHGEILPENVEAIVEMVKQGIKVVIFSNMEATDRYDPLIEKVLEETGFEIQVIMSIHPKPDVRGFLEAQTALQLADGEEVAMVGDNFSTDGGSIRAGIPFIKVDPIKTPGLIKRTIRFYQTVPRTFQAGISRIYDFFGRRVLRDKDLQ